MTMLRNTWLALLALVALLAVASVSCGPGSATTPPTEGDIEVHIIVDGPGRVIVGSSPHECRADCRWTGDAGVDTRLEAVPAPGNVFVAWEGTCDAFENPCIRALEDGDTIKATFAPQALRLALTGDGEGTFSIKGAGIDTTCDDDCGVGLDTPGLHLAITAHLASDRTTLDEDWSVPCVPPFVQSGYCVVEVTGLTTARKTWRHPPVAVDDAYATMRNVTLTVGAANGILANDDDTPDDTLTALLVTGTQHGSLTLAADGSFEYVPDAGYAGPDGFRYRVRDAFGNEDAADVTIAVVNRPPVAENDAYATTRNVTLVVDAANGVLANDHDPDGDPLTALLVTGVDHGLLVLAADGSFSYTPTTDSTGTDTFTYVAHDGLTNSNTATVTITVSTGQPIAVDDSYATTRDSTLRRNAAQGVLANDVGVNLTAILVRDVDEGDLTLNADGSFTYVSDDDFIGTDVFTYRARDLFGRLSNTATVTITIRRR